MATRDGKLSNDDKLLLKKYPRIETMFFRMSAMEKGSLYIFQVVYSATRSKLLSLSISCKYIVQTSVATLMLFVIIFFP